MAKSLLDTDIFSEILKNKHPVVSVRAADYHKNFRHYTTSSLTVTEVVSGYQQAQRPALLEAFRKAVTKAEILSFGTPEADLAGQFLGDLARTGQPIGVFDPMIAAIAIVHGLTLVTGNTEHFRRIQQLGYPLRLDNWRKPVS